MIFITGDVHAGIDIQKLNSRNFPQHKNLSKSDYVIVTGDAGFIWDGSREEKYWLKWLQKKNFTTLFVDGNHENFDLLNSFPIENWNGGKIHRINDSVILTFPGSAGVKVNSPSKKRRATSARPSPVRPAWGNGIEEVTRLRPGERQ